MSIENHTHDVEARKAECDAIPAAVRFHPQIGSQRSRKQNSIYG